MKKAEVFILLTYLSIALLTSCTEEPIEPKETSAKQLGKEYFLKGEYFNALENYYEALDFYRNENNQLEIAKITNNIGVIYTKAGFYSMSLEFYFDAYEQRKSLNNQKEMAELCYNIGKSFRKNKQNDKAKEYLNYADTLFSLLNMSKHKSMVYNDLGNLYLLNDSNYLEARK